MDYAEQILLVDADAEHRASLVHELRGAGLVVEAAADVLAALLRVFARAPALILVSAVLLDGECSSFVRLVRGDPRASEVPIVALLRRPSAADAAVDEVLVDPVAPQDLLARIRALVLARRRRLQGACLSAGVWFDVQSSALRRDQRHVTLRPTEARLLEFLLLHPGVVLSRRLVLERVWGGRETHSRVVDTTVCRLRRALEQLECPDAVESVRGRGYRLFLRDTSGREPRAAASRSFDPATGVNA